MPSTDEIIQAAGELGKLVAGHEDAEKYQEAIKALQADTSAQRAVADMQRFTFEIEQKAAMGQPIEVADKQKLETLRTAVVTNPVLTRFQTARMAFVDLMRKIDDALAAETGGITETMADPGAAMGAEPPSAGGAGGAGPIIGG